MNILDCDNSNEIFGILIISRTISYTYDVIEQGFH